MRHRRNECQEPTNQTMKGRDEVMPDEMQETNARQIEEMTKPQEAEERMHKKHRTLNNR